MDNRALIGVIVVVILAGAALIVFLQANNPSAVMAKFCSPGEPSVKLYQCERGVYEIASLPDVGISYVDSMGNKLAQCNGFINKPNPPECATYAAYACDRTKNLCIAR